MSGRMPKGRLRKRFFLAFFLLLISLLSWVTPAISSQLSGLFAGGSDPGVVYRYLGGTEWEAISRNLGYAVLALVGYEGELYAGTTSEFGGGLGVGRVYRYEGGMTWTRVGDNMDNEVCALAVYEGDLYAGTAWNGFRLYKYTQGSTNCGIANWTRVVNDADWSGIRSLCVSRGYLFMGDILLDYIGRWDGADFHKDQTVAGGSCIYDFQDYDGHMYGAAYQGRLWRSTDTVNWTVVLDYYDGNMWQLEEYAGNLYMSYNNGELREFTGTGDLRGTLVFTASDGVISMLGTGAYLYFGTGGDAVGFGAENTGVANVYRYNGGSSELICTADQFGSGVQSLLYMPSHRIAYIPVKYKTAPSGKTPTHTISELRQRAGLVEDYYREQSYGEVNLESEFVFDEWELLDKKWVDYDANNNGTLNDRTILLLWFEPDAVRDDAIQKASASADLDVYGAILVLQPDGSLRSYARGNRIISTSKENYAIWAHELGHALFSWYDYYYEEWYLGSRGDTQYWELMGNGCLWNPLAPIMSHLKVSQKWLEWETIYARQYGEYKIDLLKDLERGAIARRYQPRYGPTRYYIFEGRDPPDGVLLDDEYAEWNNLEEVKGVLLYRVTGGAFFWEDYVYTVPHGLSNHRRVTLPPGSTYRDTEIGVRFTVSERGSNLYLEITEDKPRNTEVVSLFDVIAEFFGGLAPEPFPLMEQFDVDLHVYSNDGRHVGINYETMEYEVQIEGAETSGDSPGGGPEWISIPDGVEYYAVVDATSARRWAEEHPDLEVEDLNVTASATTAYYDETGERTESEPITVEVNLQQPTPADNTPTGTKVKVEFPAQGITVIFDEVTSTGNTTLSVATDPPFGTFPEIQFLNKFYQFNTTATYVGIVTIIINYDDSGLTKAQEEALRLFKVSRDSEVDVADITTEVDTRDNLITGKTESFSFFAVGYVTNHPPTPDAGPDRTVATGTPVELNGCTSYDPDGDEIIFHWDVVEMPPTTEITADIGDTEQCTFVFTPLVPGEFTVELTVTDSKQASATDQVVITAVGEDGETVTHHYCEGWQMLSIPVCCASNDTDTVIGDDVANPFLWRWNPGNGAYLLADEVNPTWGYWLLVPEGGVVIDATGIEPQSDVTVSVSPVGWHQISTPWPYDVDDTRVHRGTHVKPWNEAVSAGWLEDVIWGYDGAEYALASRIAPWSGYWVLPLVDGLTLEFHRSSAYPAGTAASDLETTSVAPLSLPPPVPEDTLSSIGTLHVINIPNPITDLNTTTFSVQGVREKQVKKVRVEIFDLSGHLVYSEECSAVSIEWHTQNNLGEPLANGAYLYRVWALIDGEWRQSEFKKLAICR